MKFVTTLLWTASIVVISYAAPAPCYNTTNIADIAGGDLPNSLKPVAISASAVKDLQLALFLENLETAYFLTGLTNITAWGVSGYLNDTLNVVSSIAAQELVHVATVADLLRTYDAPLIPSCNYSFPVRSTPEFFAVADIITSVGISATIGLADRLAHTDPELINSVSSILAVESRHDAFFRHIRHKSPNPAPFDTGISDIWAYNLALSFVVPGSCPVEIPLPVLPVLGVSDPSTTANGHDFTGASLLEFTWDPLQTTFVAEAGKQLLVGWVNQLNVPVYTTLNITAKGKGTAAVPAGLNGVVYAAIATQQPEDINELALVTLAGPIVINLS